MMTSTQAERQKLWQLDRASLESHQLVRFNELLSKILPANSFYAQKLGAKDLQLGQLSDLKSLPFTTKEELIAAQEKGLWKTFPSEEYVRYHQTSGTSGRPLPIVDTAADWQEWIGIWQHVLDAAEINAGETAMLAFSFGPFIGFWSAFDALVARGVRAIPGGGLSSLGRLDLIKRTDATSLFCTPSYAIHLAEVGQQNGIDLKELPIETVFVAGEPGGSVPAIRSRIETAWGARVVDHAGASEVGPWGFGDDRLADDDPNYQPSLRIIESDFIAEFISIETGSEAEPGELSRLILTNLGRAGLPVIRYDTGDLVRPQWKREQDENQVCRFVQLQGGVLGRSDDMMVIRGVNIYPTAIEQILCEFPEVAEYRMIATKQGAMDELRIEVEDAKGDPGRIADRLQIRLGLRTEVRCVELGSLPRSEAKSRRFVRES